MVAMDITTLLKLKNILSRTIIYYKKKLAT